MVVWVDGVDRMSFTNTDNPIKKIEDDALGFSSLAKRVATSITNTNIDTTNSFTISIEGQWGSGKTSLVNLIRNELKDDVIVLKFNPWMINDFEQLIKYFFSEFIKIVTKEIAWYKPNKISKRLKKMASILTPAHIRVGTRNLSATYKTKDLFFSEKTIYELKSEINSDLKKLNKRIVIIVDDIDRLTDKETETFFRLIKGIADFDNLVYLLLYDKAIVSKSLETFKQENGERYLDKIVQYSISIPKVYNSVLNKILFDKLDNILEKIDKHNFNRDKWDKFIPLLDKYIKNIRDINKVVSVISFEYPQIATEVEFTDFFILSLIKVQKYELYELIRDRRYIFESSMHNRLLMHKDKEMQDKFNKEKKEFTDKIFARFLNHKPLFYELFPQEKDEEYYGWNPISVHKDKPIDNAHYFDNYFTFSVADNKFSSEEYYELSQKLLLSDVKEFESAILKIEDIDKLSLFVEMFRSIDENKVLKDINITKNVIINLLIIYKKLPTLKSDFYPSSWKYFNVAQDIFEKSDNPDMLLEAIYLNKNAIRLEAKLSFYRKMKEKHDYDTRFDKKIIDKIEKILEKNLKLITLSDLILEKNDINRVSSIYYLISFYKLLNISVDPLLKEINERVFKSRDEFFNVLTLFKSEVSISGGKPFLSISSENISEYTNLDIQKLEEYMNNLDEKTFSKKEQEIFDAWGFRNAY